MSPARPPRRTCIGAHAPIAKTTARPKSRRGRLDIPGEQRSGEDGYSGGRQRRGRGIRPGERRLAARDIKEQDFVELEAFRADEGDRGHGAKALPLAASLARTLFARFHATRLASGHENGRAPGGAASADGGLQQQLDEFLAAPVRSAGGRPGYALL